MEIIIILIPIALILTGIAFWAFFWSVNSGQFDDLESPAHSILYDDDDHLIPDDAKVDTDQTDSNKADNAKRND
ncbi:cbb3-type cytochrome oxidase assembly protein CcoS [Nitrincola tibetensis]|uniref:Cbb3-type cytochrome oxidase assembly protein CcoS n=1 Tax=Nitrincola tibetensis TaxID=2219697 RepID=A0A364NL45_9GAMM|nr:cbb3-type cytochrome oxidase assembly protein CcoS [Nitrincola tibetensis]RAU17720.1 cbb3-type cytochrome oxidase assembly protein CcoS [Nitrincola tibetensis]